MSRLLGILGLPSAAALGWYALAFVLAMGMAAGIGGLTVHRYDTAQHARAIADLRTAAAATLAEETGKVLTLLQAEIDRNAELEANYARLSQDTARAQADGVRLSADLDAARQRLLQFARAGGSGGGRADGQAGAGAGGCETVRATLARTLGALELLERAGDQIAVDGQHAVDVATIAAQAAKTSENGHE